MINFRLALILVLCSLFISCVETLITINILPDARYRMSIVSKGDKEDIENNDFTLPKSAEWSIKTFQEIDDETGDMIFFSSGESMLEVTNLLINNFHSLSRCDPVFVTTVSLLWTESLIIAKY